MESSPILFEWISEPIQSQPILDRFIFPDFLLVRSGIEPLVTGANKYYCLVIPLESGTGDKIKSIQQEIESISYLPLVFTLSVPSGQWKRLSQGLKDILIQYLSETHHLQASLVDATYLQHLQMLTLQPVTADGHFIYMSPSDHHRLKSNLDLESILGYDLLSGDPLIWFYLSQHNQLSEWGIRSWHQLAVIPIIPPSREESNLSLIEMSQDNEIITPEGDRWRDRDLFKAETQLFVTSLHRQGYVGIYLRDSDIDLVRDLCQRWSIQYYGSFSPNETASNSIHVIRPTIKLLIDIKTWISQTLLRHQHDQVPLYCFGGDWMQSMEPTLDTLAKLEYGAIQAYRQIAAESNPKLDEYVSQVRCLPNLSISAPFTQLNEVEAMKVRFTQLFPVMVNWQVIACPDVDTAVIRSSWIRDRFPSLHQEIIRLSAHDLIYVVVDTPAGLDTIKVPDDLSSG